jgi:uncharacterized repeat protein (TIGR03803 family)
LYGTAQNGGAYGNGTVFKLDQDGTGFTNLHNFPGTTSSTNAEGARPSAGLLLLGDTLYGTAAQGGSFGFGTIFAIKTNGLGFTNFHSFNTADGIAPQARLTFASGALYGAAKFGGTGASSKGSIFRINPDGTGFTNLHSFSNISGPSPGTNSGGASLYGELIISGNTMYGTAHDGGANGCGTVFKLNTTGLGFSVLHDFAYCGPFASTNTGGANPSAGLVLGGCTLFGTTWNGGSSANGIVFSISLNPELTISHSGSNIILRWPTNFTGFTLQFATNLAPPPLWMSNSSGAIILNGQNVVTNSVSSVVRFFRLIQ